MLTIRGISDPLSVAYRTKGLNSSWDDVGPDRFGVFGVGARDWDFGATLKGSLGVASSLRRLLDNDGPDLIGVSGDGD
jgi:carbohydrate-binding DOMON domain-containing protein